MSYAEYRKLRDDRGMTDSDVAKQTGISRSTFSDWKAGRYEPKQDKLQKLADFFGVPIETFTGTKYYTDAKTAEIAERIRTDNTMRMLFDVSRDADPETLLLAAQLIERMKKTNRDE